MNLQDIRRSWPAVVLTAILAGAAGHVYDNGPPLPPATRAERHLADSVKVEHYRLMSPVELRQAIIEETGFQIVGMRACQNLGKFSDTSATASAALSALGSQSAQIWALDAEHSIVAFAPATGDCPPLPDAAQAAH